ncbi:MAG: PfkB family carbohydrate kinase [Opitutaceae bacterium]
MPAPPSVVLFGELLLRLNAEGFSRLVQSERFQLYYTGAEANAGVSLAQWGYEALVVSRVPAHDLGQACVNFLRRYGLDTRYIQRAGDRLGLFYVEHGASQRQSKVIYDRRDSAFTTFDDAQLDWDEVFRGRRWFHFSGTAPAVAPRLVPVLQRAGEAARRNGVTVSCDLNFRRKLWTPEQAQQTMTGLMEYVDVLICNEEDAEMVFGIKARGTDVRGGRLSRAGYEDVARQLQGRFDFSHVAITLRESLSASVNNWSALLLVDGAAAFSRKYQIQIVDRIGGGDSFAAGLIYGVCEGMTAQQTVEFAVAASCLKHTIPGDFNLVTKEEIATLLAGDGSGRIQR